MVPDGHITFSRPSRLRRMLSPPSCLSCLTLTLFQSFLLQSTACTTAGAQTTEKPHAIMRKADAKAQLRHIYCQRQVKET